MPTYIPLPGSKRQIMSHSRPIGPVDKSEMASITVRVRSMGDLKDLEEEVRLEASKPLAERTYLTREELAQRYGSRAEDLNQVEAFSQRHNLTIAHRSAGERCVVLKGKLGDLLSAFPADVQLYDHAAGRYRGRQGEIRVPADLAPIVTGIFGFDTRPKRRHRFQGATQAGPGGANGVPATFFAQRYHFPSSYQNKVLDGAGQTIAVIELGGGFQTSDLQIYFNEINRPLPAVSSISVDHAGNNPTSSDSPADQEVMLDIEVAGAVAPGAKIAVYFAPNEGDKGFVDAISAAVNDSERRPDVISISWGLPELDYDEQARTAFHELFLAASKVGMTVCVATGDHGTADLPQLDADHPINVDFPSSDPLVLACGGTQIDVASNTDVVWNDGQALAGGGGWAGGGGISAVNAVPTYQASAGLPNSISTGNPGRGVPDIAMSATNYFVRVDTWEGPSGGTSAVAPLMAALVTLLNQAKEKNVGFLNPFLYANVAKGIVHDVTSGTNAIFNTVAGYSAGPGWDACTGLGTPDGEAILNNL